MRIFIILIICTSLSSCIFSDHRNNKSSITESSLRNRHIESFPKTNDLHGIWTITDHSKKLILNHANQYPTWDSWSFTFQKIELFKEGRVKAWVNTPPLPTPDKMISGDIKNGFIMGKWEVIETEIRDYYYSDSLQSYSIAFNFGYPKYSYNRLLYICKNNNEIILWTYVQDPDNTEYQEFKKIKT